MTTPPTPTPTLHPTMMKADLDSVLAKGFGVKDNPYTVQELFELARPMNATGWPSVLRVLKLNDEMGSRLVMALGAARSSKAPAPAPPPPSKQQLDAATFHRLEKVANAKPGEQASIFGTDVRGQPVDVNGDVVQKASNWGALLSGKQPKATSSAFSAEAQAARKEKEAKKAAAAELAAVPATTLRVPKPHDKKGLGWRWRPDVEWAHEHRAELVAFLQTDLKDETTPVHQFP